MRTTMAAYNWMELLMSIKTRIAALALAAVAADLDSGVSVVRVE